MQIWEQIWEGYTEYQLTGHWNRQNNVGELRITNQCQGSTPLSSYLIIDDKHRPLRIWWPDCWRSGIPERIGCNWNSDIQKNWWSSWQRTGISTHPSTSVKDYRGRSTQFRSVLMLDRKSKQGQGRQRMMSLVTAPATTTESRREWIARHPFRSCPL